MVPTDMVSSAPAPHATGHCQRQLRLAIYYPWLYLQSGGERTIYEFVARSRHDWTIITNRYDADSTYPELRKLKIVQLDPVSVKRTFTEVLRAGARIFTQKLPLEGFDGVLVFCEGLGDLILFRNSHLPTVCYCFTPLRAAFDEHYQARYLAMNGNSMPRRAALRIGAVVFRWIDRQAWKRYQHVFVMSLEVGRRIREGRLCGPEKMSMLYAGIDTKRMRPSYHYEPYFLLPGRIMWTKNTELGIQSFIEMKRQRPDLAQFELVIAGFVDNKSKPYLAKLRGLADGRTDIRFVVAPSDEELFGLYDRCFSVLYTPFNEDMGLIPVEAMAFGKPIVTVNRGGPRETVTDGETGFLLEPNAQSMATALIRLADNPGLVRTMGERGVQAARRFDWSHFQQVIDSHFEGLSAARSPR
jgi:glycosyltransferase involved in cell wall biosynthesis